MTKQWMTNPTRASVAAVLVLFCTTSGVWSLDVGRPASASGTADESAGNAKAGSDGGVGELRGEWHRAGPGFVCQVAAPHRLPPEAIKPEVLERACLHIGPFVIGAESATLQPVVGAPSRTLPQPKGATASVYFLESPGHYPYLVATVSQDRIVALQITGVAAAKGFSFNHVDLGASTDALIQYFGQPKHLQPSSEKETDLWSYTPWPFSFEVKDGHVTSIRIADPEYF
jgi:hypothetical protein